MSSPIPRARFPLLAGACLLLPACTNDRVVLLDGDDGGSSSGPDDTTTTTTTGTTFPDPTSPSSTSSGPADDTTVDPDATGSVFVPEPPCELCFECDIFAQDCPAGEKCMPWANDGGSAWNAFRCSPIADDPGTPGDSCTVEGSGVSGIDDCEPCSTATAWRSCGSARVDSRAA